MKKIRRWIRNYFGFTRNQVNGFMLLIPLMLLTLISAPVFEWFRFRNSEVPLEEEWMIDSVVTALKEEPRATAEEEISSPFAFDPNTASVEELEALGFRTYLAKRIVNYRQKGGRFIVKADLYKIYGIDSAQVTQLLPFVQLPDRAVDHEDQPKIFKVAAPFNMNEADSSQLQSVSGIGPVLSQRIVNYRNSLGGFVKPHQLFEVWGLDSAVVGRLQQASFIEQSYQPRQINVNTADESELARHPYLNKKMARAIVTYRFQHGSFEDINDLTKIAQIDNALLEKARPYLTVR